MRSLFTILKDRAARLWTEIGARGDWESVLPLLRPVSPYAGPEALSPLAMIGVLLALTVASGVALAALGVLLLALLVLYLLFTEVLGLRIEVKPIAF